MFAEEGEELRFPHEGYSITTVSFYKNKRTDWAVKALWSLLTDWKERYFAREVRRHIQNQQYDAVLCTTFSTFPLDAAAAIAQEKQLPLIADIRDLDEQAPNSQYQAHRQWWAKPLRGWYRRTYIRRRNKAIGKAQLVTTVSPWHQAFIKKLNPHTELVLNGYDQKRFYPNPVQCATFDIVYTGRIYESELQDPRCFFEGLSLLQPKEDMRIVWYTNKEGGQRVHAYAKKYGIRCPMLVNNYVQPDEVPDILNKSSIVLVFSHKETKEGPHGIMTTKFYEALGVEKPVLCAPSDEGCLAAVIHRTNAGIAARTPQEVAAFIEEKYIEWKQNTFTRQAVNKEEKQQFARQVQAKRFEEYIRHSARL